MRKPRTNATTLVALSLAAVLVLAGVTGAQTVTGQADALAERAQSHADALADDPEGFVDDARNDSWRASQVNWTVAWTCDSSAAAHEAAREHAEAVLDCPSPEDASAGDEDDEEDEAQADAEKLENETRTTAEDQAAATEAFVEKVTEDPGNADEHAMTFVERTVQTIQRLIGAPVEKVENAIEEIEGEIEALGETLEDLVEETKDLIRGLITGSIDGLSTGLTVLGTGMEAVIDGIATGAATALDGAAEGAEQGAVAIGDAVQAATDAIGDLVRGDRACSNENLHDPAPADASPVETDRLPVDVPVSALQR